MTLEGEGHLERVHWRDGTGEVTSHEIRHVFLMSGADATLCDNDSMRGEMTEGNGKGRPRLSVTLN